MPLSTMLARAAARVGICLLTVVLASPVGAFDDQVFVVASHGSGAGSCAALDPLAPWSARIHLEPVGARPVARHFAGLHYVVNGAPDDEVQIIDPETFETLRRFSVGPGSDPRDIAVVDPTTAYVSRFESRWLLRVDPTSGAFRDSLDLGIFADDDGLLEMAMMALDGRHLFVQIQRVDRRGSGPINPGFLAVVDVQTNQLVDVDPGTPGTQAIHLAGPKPSYKMHVEPETRRLFVCTPGELLDGLGGIDAVDLDVLRSLGYVVSENADIGAFVMVSPTKGYLISHTDFATSSHLDAFSRVDGSFIASPYMTFEWVESLAFDPQTGLLFFPDPNPSAFGIHVFDAVADSELTEAVIPTGQPPRDLLIARAGVVGVPSPGGGTRPRVLVNPNPVRGSARIRLVAGPGMGALAAEIYDVMGRLVRRLSAEGPAAAGGLAWDGRDEHAAPVAPGLYLIRVLTPGLAVTGRAVVVR